MAQGDLNRLLLKIQKNLKESMDTSPPLKGGKSGSDAFREDLESRVHDVYLDENELVSEALLQIQDFKKAYADAGFTQAYLEYDKRKSEAAKSGQKFKEVAPVLGQAFRKEVGSGAKNTREQAQNALNVRANAAGLGKDTERKVRAAIKSQITSARALGGSNKRTGKISGNLRIRVMAENPLVLRFSPVDKTKVTNSFNSIKTKILVDMKNSLVNHAIDDILGGKFNRSNPKHVDVALDVKRRFFNLGHIRSVAEVKSSTALQQLDRGLRKVERTKYEGGSELGQAFSNTLRLEMYAKFSKIGSPELRKEFTTKIMNTKPESEARNLTDSSFERMLLTRVSTFLSATIKNLPNDWASQKSSASLIEAMVEELKVSAKKGGAKTTLKNLGMNPSKAASSFKLKQPKKRTATPVIASSERLKLGIVPAKNIRQVREISSTISLLYLVPLINQRLADVIRSHMGQAGRLVNRTGRFSESAQVMSNDGFTFIYTYQEDPYGVFEAQGARDPRPLIEQSIREIAATLTREKFNLLRGA
jgi:hypothetical protein